MNTNQMIVIWNNYASKLIVEGYAIEVVCRAMNKNNKNRAHFTVKNNCIMFKDMLVTTGPAKS